MERLLSPEYIDLIFTKIVTWCIETIPGLVLALMLFMVMRYILRKAVIRFEKGLDSQQVDDGDKVVEEGKRATTMVGILEMIANTIIWVIFVFTLLNIVGFNVTAILASAGVLSLAISFGAQELVRDAISGFFLLFEDRVRVNDVVCINGQSGTVEDIDLRTITLRDLTGTIHVLQNGKIDTLANMTKDWSAMVFDIGVAYKENVDKVATIIESVGDELQHDADFADKIIEPIEIFGLDKFDDSAVIIKARIKTVTSEQWAIKRAFNKRLKIAFDKAEIEIPFPQRSIHINTVNDPSRVA